MAGLVRFRDTRPVVLHMRVRHRDVVYLFSRLGLHAAFPHDKGAGRTPLPPLRELLRSAPNFSRFLSWR